MTISRRFLVAFFAAVVLQVGFADLSPTMEETIASVIPNVVAWRRDFHEHPELGNS